MATEREPDKARLETQRGISILPESYQESDNSVEIVFAAGERVLKYDYRADVVYIEDLPLSGMDVSVLNKGAHVLRAHNIDDVDGVIGSVIPGSAAVTGDEARARIMLSAEDVDRAIVNKIRSGIVRKWSYGYQRVGPYTVSRDAESGMEIRTWARHVPFELSAVAVPADGGTNTRAHETPTGAVKTQEDTMDNQETRTPIETPVDVKAIAAQARKAEADRQKSIRSLMSKAGLTEDECRTILDDPEIAPEAAALRMWDLRVERDAKTVTHSQINVTGDEGDNTMRAISGAVAAKMGEKLPDESRGLRAARVGDLAREYLRIRGIRCEGRGDREVCDMAIRAPAAHTTSDFTAIFSNVLNKKLQAAYELSSDYTWWQDLSTRQDFTDDRPRRIVSVSGLGVLPVVEEGAEYQGLTQYDAYEEIAPVKRGGEFRMTLEMMVRDDLSAFARQAMEFGKSSQFSEHTDALAALTAAMSDTFAVCSIQHANLSAAGGVPTIALIAELDALLRAQTDGNGHVVGKGGLIGLFPLTAKVIVEQMYSSQVMYAVPADAPTVPLLPANRRYVPGLTGAYFLCTGDALAMEHGWVAEDGGPVVSEHAEYNTDSLVYHGRDWFGIGVVKYREFAQNPGA